MLLQKNGATIYTFPAGIANINGDSLQSRMTENPRAMQHGSVGAGDGKFDFRTVDISVYLEGSSITDYQTKADALKGAAARADKLFLTDSRYIKVDGLHKVKTAWLPGFYLVRANVTLTMKCYDPFWYDTTAGTDTEEIEAAGTSEAPHTWTITNDGNIDVPVVLTITATGAVPSLSLKNVTDNGRLLAYADANFTAGKILIISPLVAGGSVTLNGANTINNFAGLFMRLLPGANVFEYVGAPCTIEASWPVGWI